MSSSKRWLVLLLLLLLLAGLLWKRYGSREEQVVLPPPVVEPTPAPVVEEPPKPAAKPKPAATTSTGAPVPPNVELHTELIPKNIEIARCYYAAEVAPPGSTFGFDINGTGFTSEFHRMIKVEAGAKNISIKNLKLVTANQIHGDVVVGGEAKTGFVYPRVLIKGLPVFSAPDPFAVVRKGEILTVFFTSMEENGRGGSFRVITNLDEQLASGFRIVPSTAGIDVNDIRPELPYLVHGRMQIKTGVPPGEHGLTMYIHGKEVFKRTGMIRIVRPNIGQMGFIQNLTADERYYRPGDVIQFYIQGTGLSVNDLPRLTAKIEGYDVGGGTMTYLSPLQLRVAMQTQTFMPLKAYTVKIVSDAGVELYEKKNLFELIGANWVAGVQVSPPLVAGGQSRLKIIGRDFSDAFVSSLRIDVDEPGLTIGAVSRENAKTLAADIQAASGIKPGDYWLHLSAEGKKLAPPYGSIIKVEAP